MLAIAVDSEEIATEATIAAIAQRRCCCGRPSTIRGVSIALILSCMCPGDPAAGGAPDHRLLFILCSVRSLQWPIRMRRMHFELAGVDQYCFLPAGTASHRCGVWTAQVRVLPSRSMLPP